MRRIVAFCLVLCFALTFPAIAQERITIAAYNVENFFDTWNDPYTNDGDPKSPDDTALLAAALRELDADIIGLSEIENTAVLDAMVQQYLPDMRYTDYTVQPTNSGRGINLGIISRYPITSITSYRFNDLTIPGTNQTWRFARDLFHAVIDVNGTPVDIMVVHFKSKRDSEGDPQSANWRYAEALFTRQRIDQILADNPDRLLAVMGDFNDTEETRTMTTLTEGPLASLHAHLPAEQRVTYLREPYRSQIDYILASPALQAITQSATVPTDPTILNGSDHAPVAATFLIP